MAAPTPAPVNPVQHAIATIVARVRSETEDVGYDEMQDWIDACIWAVLELCAVDPREPDARERIDAILKKHAVPGSGEDSGDSGSGEDTV